jgi:hypothetical protein
MRTQKIPFVPYYVRVVLVVAVLASSLIFSVSYPPAYAHTFSTSESADFLSLVEQIRAQTALVSMNLENNNMTLAQAHAKKVPDLLTNSTLDEIWEVNTRIASGLESGLEQLEGNVTSLAASSSAQQGQIPQDRIQSISQIITNLNDTLSETVTVRIESEQRDNATTWAMALADLVNVALSDYRNATGATFDLTDISNLAGVQGTEMMNDSSNTTTMTTIIDDNQMQVSGNSSSSNNTFTATANASSATSNMTTTTTIVDTSAYQSAQYLANNTLVQLFNDMLKPLTTSGNAASTGNNTTSNIDRLEAGLLQLGEDINSKASPNQVMTTAHMNIHPIIMQTYGLTIEEEEGQ